MTATRASASLRAYCTYFDSGYLARGLTLIDSLRHHGDESPVFVLALDQATKDYLDEAALPGVTALMITDIEAEEPELPPLRSQRSRMEYYFTATPLLIRWVIRRQTDPSTVVIYLDSDLSFSDDPQLVLDALGDGSVGIIEHKYPPRLASRLSKYGRFNVGWVGIRADADGKACVDWWGARTLEWCFDRPDQGRYADQGYLDQFPDLFAGVVVLPSQGFNLAPWNTAGRRLAATGDRVTIDGHDQLVFFHFHGLRRLGAWYVSSQFIYGSGMSRVLRRKVYEPYVARLEEAEGAVRSQLGAGLVKRRGNGLWGLIGRLRKGVFDAASIVTGNAVSIKAARRHHAQAAEESGR